MNTVNIHGGEVNGPIAVGPHARASVTHAGNSPERAEIAALLDRLERLLAEHAGQVEEPERAARDAGDVRQELAEADPDRSRVLDALRRLSVRAGEVTAIVEVVDRIRELLG
ncbi:MAG: hypothetical protein HOV86_04065 [Thermoactinospora sp.]|nr:hypothetical protein [Thermoactinospora sp.]